MDSKHSYVHSNINTSVISYSTLSDQLDDSGLQLVCRYTG